MTSVAPVRLGLIGVGAMARYHLRSIIGRDDTVIPAVCDGAEAAFDEDAAEETGRGVEIPQNEPDWATFIRRFAPELDVVCIVTPHVVRGAQATASLEAGLDVLLEKPMVMDAEEAKALIGTPDRTGRLLVVAFPGSLSPQIRAAARMVASGEVGPLLNVNAVAWQDWRRGTLGTWRQEPAIAGGGFLFDTGAHMLNSVVDIAGEDVAELTAWLENDGVPVNVRGVVMARLTSGALVTMNGCGRAVPPIGSEIWVFCERATLRTGIWGERLQVVRAGSKRMAAVRSVASRGVWEQFLAVRDGREPNPSPPEVGLRMARLWDAIRESSSRGGAVVSPERAA